MNHTQPEVEFDADGKALGPYSEVQLVYEPALKSHPPAAPLAASALPAGCMGNPSAQLAPEEAKIEEKANGVIATPVAAEIPVSRCKQTKGTLSDRYTFA